MFGLQAKIIPVTSSGRWRGRHVVQLSNWGNAPAKLRMVASDPDEALGFYVRPEVVELPLGGTATVRVSVRTRKPFLRGSAGAAALPGRRRAGRRRRRAHQPHPALPYADPTRPVVDAALNQKPILSKAVVALLSLILVAGLGLGAYAVIRDRQTDEELAQGGPPPKPVVTVEAKGPDAVVVSWEPIAGVEGYEVYSVDPASGNTLEQRAIPAGQNGLPIDELQPQTNYCYEVSAVGAGGQKGPRSDRKCVSTAKAPPNTASPSPTPGASTQPTEGSPTTGGSPTVGQPPTEPGNPPGASSSPAVPPGSVPPGGTVPPAGGQFAGGKWIAVPYLAPVNAGAQPQVDLRVSKLKAVQLPAGSLNSADYPTLTGNATPQVPSVLVAVGPYDSKEQAQGVCPQIRAATGDPQCFFYQPQP